MKPSWLQDQQVTQWNFVVAFVSCELLIQFPFKKKNTAFPSYVFLGLLFPSCSILANGLFSPRLLITAALWIPKAPETCLTPSRYSHNSYSRATVHLRLKKPDTIVSNWIWFSTKHDGCLTSALALMDSACVCSSLVSAPLLGSPHLLLYNEVKGAIHSVTLSRCVSEAENEIQFINW